MIGGLWQRYTNVVCSYRIEATSKFDLIRTHRPDLLTGERS